MAAGAAAKSKRGLKMAKKLTIKQKVAAEADFLRNAPVAALRGWALVNGMDSQAGFANFKKALLSELGVDYDAVRGEAKTAKAAATAATADFQTTLYSDAKASKDRYAVCGPNGEPLWYGRFFDNDKTYDGEQSSGELAAALKAVWLARRIAEAAGATVIKLNLRVDAEWLTWANEAAAGDKARGGKARQLAAAAAKYGVILHVEHISGAKNPADKWTVADGHMRWDAADLSAAATPITR